MNKQLYQFISILFISFLFTNVNAQENTNPTDSVRSDQDLVPIILLDTGEEIDNTQNEGVSGLLSASKDVFVRSTDFNFSAVRYRQRGYDSENVNIFFNGVLTNDLESGWAGWSSWSGLNDVTREQESNTNLEAIDYTFGGVGGGVFIDTRASSLRKRTRVTASTSTRGNYNHRLMVNHNTGMMENGWAFGFMASRRWADEGYIPGTFYDGYSYFVSADKKINDKHLFNVVFLGAPNNRGKQGAAVQEMFDLAGTNFYNPNWGYQNGKKRNARVARRHQPLAMFRHDWKMNEKTTLTTAISYQTGKNGSTRLEWGEAADPRPDYYRKLPSYSQVPDNVLLLEQLFKENESVRQINWDNFYDVNRNNIDESIDPNQNRALYMVMDRRYDSDKINFNTNFTSNINNNLTLNGGLSYQRHKGDNYQLVEDLLGADYWLDIDKFAERDFVGNEDVAQNDLDNPDRLVTEGDRFGYSYQSTINKSTAWGQANFSIDRLGFFVAANVSNSNFFRTGDYRNGRFPDSSKGDSEKLNYFNYGVKGGLNYGFNGRNYVYANATYFTRSPYFRNAFLSPRTRNEVVPGLTDEQVYSGEVAYLLNAPSTKAKIGAYYTKFNNKVETKSFYHDELRSFVNYIMTDVDKQHMGLEFAIKTQLGFIPGLQFEGAASLGQFTYTSRPSALISRDNDSELLASDRTVYIKNFYIPGTPQTAITTGLEYQTQNYLTINANFNYFDNIWMDFNPDRRTEIAVQGTNPNTDVIDPDYAVDPNSQNWTDIIHQEKAPAAYTLDISLRKSFRLSHKYSMYANIGVNNLLNTSFISNGFEQLRFDYVDKDVNRFPTKYYYARGINYFLNLSFTMR